MIITTYIYDQKYVYEYDNKYEYEYEYGNECEYEYGYEYEYEYKTYKSANRSVAINMDMDTRITMNMSINNIVYECE